MKQSEIFLLAWRFFCWACLFTVPATLEAQLLFETQPLSSTNGSTGLRPVKVASGTDPDNSYEFLQTRTHSKYPRIAADFEPQSALVLSVSDWQPHHAFVLKQLVGKTYGHVSLVVLCNDREQLLEVMKWLKDISHKCTHVYFAEFPLDTIWLRDFAPFFGETESGFQAIDFYYTGQRPKDDRMPHEWARRSGGSLKEIPWTLQGGNLLTNGQYIGITTSRIFQDNAIQFPSPSPGMNVQHEARKMVVDAITGGCNLGQLVLLEPLQSEATQHCDMFAAFLDTDLAVVAQLDPNSDPVNAAILDRNARRLQSVRVDGRPMRVQRIPIPPRDGQSWSAFTNVIIANDLVLIPIYDRDPRTIVDRAIQIYRQLLPDHTVETVNISSFKELQGELHCLSMNLPKFADMPTTVSYQQVVDFFKLDENQVDRGDRRQR